VTCQYGHYNRSYLFTFLLTYLLTYLDALLQTRWAGIRGQWIDTWRPSDNSELGLILEDDISVSKYAYRWLRAVHAAYRDRSDFVGTSLNSDQMTIVSASPKGRLAAPKNDTLLMYKCVGAWGLSPTPYHWRRFQAC